MSNNIKKSQTLQTSHEIKQNLEHHIHYITSRPEIFAQSPLDFSRNRKLSFEKPTIIIADCGYESFNVYEHIRKSGQKFVIRVKDT